MEYYSKGRVVEVEEEGQPFSDLPEQVIKITVEGGTEIDVILDYASTYFKPQTQREILFTGIGPGAQKAISCCKTMNRNFDNGLYQMTKFGYRKVEEYWDPIDPALDCLKVVREIRCIYILLSKDELDPNEDGYQGPGHVPPLGSGQPKSTKSAKKFAKKRKTQRPVK